MRILIVEDHPETLEMVAEALREAGYAVDEAADLQSAEACLASSSYDALVLDWMLPDGDGVDFCRQLRSTGNAMPCLMLTARGDVADRVAGLEAGADDYLRKPFAVAELNARLRALLRRGPEVRTETQELGPATVELVERRVTIDGIEVALTAREFSLLEALLIRRGRPVSRSEILRHVWEEEAPGAAASLEVLISRLRRKLSTSDTPCPIRTHRGFGYSVPRSS